MTDRTDPVVEARPLTAEELTAVRREHHMGQWIDGCVCGAVDCEPMRLLATLDTARAAVPESSLDVERLAQAVHRVEQGMFKTTNCYHDPRTGAPVDCLFTAEAIAREYAALTNPSKPDEPA